jgi:hypothetical protein
VGELLAPLLGGTLFDKTGYTAVFSLLAGILVLDFLMRTLVVEKRVAARYESSDDNAANPRLHGCRGEDQADDGHGDGEEENGETTLLPKEQEVESEIPEGQTKLVRNLLILYTLSNIQLLVALLVAFLRASLGAFGATAPTETEERFGFRASSQAFSSSHSTFHI